MAAVTTITCATKTVVALQELLIDVLDRAIAGRPISLSGPFSNLLRTQERIGWRAMLQGYWSVEWQTTYLSTYEAPTTESRKDKQQWILAMALWQKRVLTTTWPQMIRLWTLRNEERHGRDAETKEQARREVLLNAIRTVYEDRD